MNRRAAPPAAAPCPCGRGTALAHCCGRYLDHFDSCPAPDAERLMRSRYSAFVQEDAAWLLATWHARTRPAQIDFEPGVQWLGLEVRRHRPIDAAHAEVEFVARYRVGGRAVRLHETSRFVREGGHWLYVDGTQHERGKR